MPCRIHNGNWDWMQNANIHGVRLSLRAENTRESTWLALFPPLFTKNRAKNTQIFFFVLQLQLEHTIEKPRFAQGCLSFLCCMLHRKFHYNYRPASTSTSKVYLTLTYPITRYTPNTNRPIFFSTLSTDGWLGRDFESCEKWVRCFEFVNSQTFFFYSVSD